jgi:hypothetical protein
MKATCYLDYQLPILPLPSSSNFGWRRCGKPFGERGAEPPEKPKPPECEIYCTACGASKDKCYCHILIDRLRSYYEKVMAYLGKGIW